MFGFPRGPYGEFIWGVRGGGGEGVATRGVFPPPLKLSPSVYNVTSKSKALEVTE